MTEKLNYETIPNEFWPKCSWCGKDLGARGGVSSSLRKELIPLEDSNSQPEQQDIDKHKD